MEKFSNWGCRTTAAPTLAPTTAAPTTAPPTKAPTSTPTTAAPTLAPTTAAPTKAPTSTPTTAAPTTAAPTSTPTTAPPTKAPTSTPTTAAPTLAPTIAPTAAPTIAPTAAPPTLYLRYESDCSTPDLSAVTGVTNFVSAAMVQAIGGYEPSGSANNYIFEIAYGGPYVPNVRDPENIPSGFPPQAPGTEGDPFLYLKYDFYQNANRYGEFLSAIRGVIDVLGGGISVLFQNVKSKTVQAESIYGAGYIAVQFLTTSSINYNKTNYVNNNDVNVSYTFTIFEATQQVPQVIACKDCISNNDGIRQFCKYSRQTTCLPVLDQSQVYKLLSGDLFNFMNNSINNNSIPNVFYSTNGFFNTNGPTLVPYVDGDDATIVALYSNSTDPNQYQSFEIELINSIYSSSTANYIMRFNLNYFSLLNGLPPQYKENDYIYGILVSEPTNSVIINPPQGSSIDMWVRVDDQASPVAPITPDLCLAPAPVSPGSGNLVNRECATCGDLYNPDYPLNEQNVIPDLTTNRTDYLCASGENRKFGGTSPSDSACKQSCQDNAPDCVAYTYTSRNDRTTPIDCVNDAEYKKFCLDGVEQQGYCILYSQCDYTVSTRLANTTSNTTWMSGAVTTVSPTIPPNTPPFFNRLLGCKSWVKDWGMPVSPLQNEPFSTQQTSEDCQKFCSNTMDGNLPSGGVSDPFNLIKTDHDEKIYAACTWNPQDKKCTVTPFLDKALDYCKDSTKYDAACIPFEMKTGALEGCLMESSCSQLGDIASGTSLYMNFINKEMMSIEFSFDYNSNATIMTCDNFNIRRDGTTVIFEWNTSSGLFDVQAQISGLQLVKFVYMYDGDYYQNTSSRLYIVNNGSATSSQISNAIVNKLCKVNFNQSITNLNVCGISPEPPSMCNAEVLYDNSLIDSSWYSWDSSPIFGMNLSFIPDSNHSDSIISCGTDWKLYYPSVGDRTIAFSIGTSVPKVLQLSGVTYGLTYNVSVYADLELIILYVALREPSAADGSQWMQTHKNASGIVQKSTWSQQIVFGSELKTLSICGGSRAQAPTAAPTAAPTMAPTAKPIAFGSQNVGCYTEDCKNNGVNYPIDYYDYGKYSSSTIIPNVAKLVSPSKTNINMGMQKNGDVYGAYGFTNILNNWQTQLYLTRKTNDPRSICNNVCWDASYRANRGRCLTNSSDATVLYNGDQLGLLNVIETNFTGNKNKVPNSDYWKNPTKNGAGPNGETLYDVITNGSSLSQSCMTCLASYQICSYNNCGSNKPGGLTEGQCRNNYCAPSLANCIGLSTVDTINLGSRIQDTSNYSNPLDFNFRYYDSSKSHWTNTVIKTTLPDNDGSTYLNKDGTINFRADTSILQNRVDVDCLCVSSSDESINIKTTPVSGTPTYSVSEVGNVCITKSGKYVYSKEKVTNTECKNLCNNPPTDFPDIGFGCAGYAFQADDLDCVLYNEPIESLKFEGINITCNAKTEIPGMDPRYSTIKIKPSTTPQSTCCSPNSVGWESMGTCNSVANITVYNLDSKDKCNTYCATEGYNIASFSPKSTDPLNGYVDNLNICSCANSCLWNSSTEPTIAWGPSQGHTYGSFTSTAVRGDYFNQQQDNTECISLRSSTINNQTLQECQQQCKDSTTLCTAISYNQTTKECHIHFDNVYTMKQSTDWRCSVRQISSGGQITFAPTMAPTAAPTTAAPTLAPTTAAPTFSPTLSPTQSPTKAPTLAPTTAAPTLAPNAPKLYLATTGSYPTYTVGLPPTVSGSILQFRGNGNLSGNWLNYPNQTYDMSKGFSFVAFFCFTSSADWQRVFDFGSGSPFNNILFTQNSNSSTFRFSIFNGTIEYACDGGAITYNTFQNFVGVYDPSIKTMRTFINGGKVGEFVLPLAVTDNRTLSNGYIGRSNWSGDNYSNMDLNYLSVYNRVLTANEIACVGIDPTIKGPCYINDEQLGPNGAHSCTTDMDCGGVRTCSVSGYCGEGPEYTRPATLAPCVVM